MNAYGNKVLSKWDKFSSISFSFFFLFFSSLTPSPSNWKRHNPSRRFVSWVTCINAPFIGFSTRPLQTTYFTSSFLLLPPDISEDSFLSKSVVFIKPAMFQAMPIDKQPVLCSIYVPAQRTQPLMGSCTSQLTGWRAFIFSRGEGTDAS